MAYKSLFAAPVKTSTPAKTGYNPVFAGKPAEKPKEQTKKNENTEKARALISEMEKSGQATKKQTETKPGIFDALKKKIGIVKSEIDPVLKEQLIKRGMFDKLKELTGEDYKPLSKSEVSQSTPTGFLNKNYVPAKGKSNMTFDVGEGLDKTQKEQAKKVAGISGKGVDKTIATTGGKVPFLDAMATRQNITEKSLADEEKSKGKLGILAAAFDLANPENAFLGMSVPGGKALSGILNKADDISDNRMALDKLDKAVNSFSSKPTKAKPGAIKNATNELKKGTSKPVRVRTLDDGTLFIEDGRHRIEAAKKLGKTDLPIEDVSHFYNEPNSFSSINDVLKKKKPSEPPVKPPKNTQDITPPAGAKERKFLQAVKTSPESAPELKAEVGKRDITYQPITNEGTLKKAQQRVKESPEQALAYVNSQEAPSAETTATAIELIRHNQTKGDYTMAADVADTIAEKLTKAGQTIQAAKMYEHLSPESVLVKAQKEIKKANKNKWVWQSDIKLDDDTAKKLSELAKEMKGAAGSAKTEIAGEIQGIMNTFQRVSALKKVSSAQTIAQLLNPKTLLTRNPLGNELFYRLERLNKYVSTPIDFAKSAITGAERTVTFKTVKQGEYWKNFLSGVKAGWKGTSPLGTQYEMYAPAFKGKWNPMTYLEKTLGASLKGFDNAAYMRAKNETIGELAYLKALNEGKSGKALKNAAKSYAENLDTNLLQIAEDYGKYITFQDDTALSKGMQAVKRALNLGQDFGMGDLVLKYPKTPSAILMRAVEYSPAGFLKSAYELAYPIMKGKSVNQREVELALTRAITGTLGFSGLGYYLADKGIITGKGEDNKNVAGLEKEAGGGKYQINFSALKRWVMSGFKDTSTQKGDKLYTYDWAQPIAISLSLGANMNENVDKNVSKEGKQGLFAGVPGTIASSMTGALETITEQPLLSGVRKLFGGYSPAESAKSVLESLPSSFTPTLLNQMRQFDDNVARETYDPSMLTRAVNKAKAKIPGVAEGLPERYTTMGKEQKNFENNSAFNVFLNPGFISTYKPTPAADMVLQIYNNSGETKQFPKVAPKNLTLYGKKFQLTGDQIQNFQKNIGESTDTVFSKLADNPNFMNQSDEIKANALNYVLTKIYNKEKLNILTKEQRKYLIDSLTEKQKKDLFNDLAN